MILNIAAHKCVLLMLTPLMIIIYLVIIYDVQHESMCLVSNLLYCIERLHVRKTFVKLPFTPQSAWQEGALYTAKNIRPVSGLDSECIFLYLSR